MWFYKLVWNGRENSVEAAQRVSTVVRRDEVIGSMAVAMAMAFPNRVIVACWSSPLVLSLPLQNRMLFFTLNFYSKPTQFGTLWVFHQHFWWHVVRDPEPIIGAASAACLVRWEVSSVIFLAQFKSDQCSFDPCVLHALLPIALL